jgi:hypothetical protein
LEENQGVTSNTPYFKGLLGRADVKAAMQESIRLGQANTTGAIPGLTGALAPNGRCCQTEYGFQFGYTITGGRSAGSVYTSGGPNYIEPNKFGTSITSGIIWATDFLHYHPGGSPLDQDDIDSTGGRNVVAFGPNGQVSCHAN